MKMKSLYNLEVMKQLCEDLHKNAFFRFLQGNKELNDRLKELSEFC